MCDCGFIIKFKARIRVNNYDFLYLKHKKKKNHHVVTKATLKNILTGHQF